MGMGSVIVSPSDPINPTAAPEVGEGPGFPLSFADFVPGPYQVRGYYSDITDGVVSLQVTL